MFLEDTDCTQLKLRVRKIFEAGLFLALSQPTFDGAGDARDGRWRHTGGRFRTLVRFLHQFDAASALRVRAPNGLMLVPLSPSAS